MKDIPVIFENNHCVVFNKPAGLAVQGGEGVKVSLDSILPERYSIRPLLVHRLDRDTSGVILVAKTKEAARGFSAVLAGARNRGVTKQYLGVCSGVPDISGVMRFDITVRGKEKKAETSYRLLSTGAAGEFPCSLLELELGTGRMHQIRRHLADLGHPLLGDDKYGDFPFNKKLRKAPGLKNLLLHASRLCIPAMPALIPGGLDITAPLPAYFLEITRTFL
jgi:23S rRNA pseudouridine955/2504/2580 synthase